MTCLTVYSSLLVATAALTIKLIFILYSTPSCRTKAWFLKASRSPVGNQHRETKHRHLYLVHHSRNTGDMIIIRTKLICVCPNLWDWNKDLSETLTQWIIWKSVSNINIVLMENSFATLQLSRKKHAYLLTCTDTNTRPNKTNMITHKCPSPPH